MRDSLGDRMKHQYENRFRNFLPRRTFTIIRVDGKSFHTYTKGLNRPFDKRFMDDMWQTMKYLCENIQGAKFGYTQSDEISILATDFDKETTDSWFDGNIQKIVSVSASMAAAWFTLRRDRIALFDSRVFIIPDPTEVQNYFIWRQKDATRNSIQSVAQSIYSHKELHGKSQDELQELIFKKGINWNDYTVPEKRGAACKYSEQGWQIIDPPIFTADREFIEIPNYA